MQSGSDSVLQRMNRRYATADYARIVDYIRFEIPEAAITTDIIVGFPGETEQEFEESFDFCHEMQFSRIHVFAYSSREGTAAAQMPGQIKPPVKKQRSEKMLELARESLENYQLRFIGQTRMVLYEQQIDGLCSGSTDTYIKVYSESTKDLANQLLPVKLIELNGEGVLGGY